MVYYLSTMVFILVLLFHGFNVKGRKRQKSGVGHTYDFMGLRLPIDDMVMGFH
jgi:hypothetical protein